MTDAGQFQLILPVSEKSSLLTPSDFAFTPSHSVVAYTDKGVANKG